jgi:hypothetical protein
MMDAFEAITNREGRNHHHHCEALKHSQGKPFKPNEEGHGN